MLRPLVYHLALLILCPVAINGFECHYDDDNEYNDRAGSFKSDLWYWPHHRVYFRQ